MSWGKNIEDILDAQKSGAIKNMYEDLDDILSPLDLADTETVRKEWQKLDGYENTVKNYLRAGNGIEERYFTDDLREALDRSFVIKNRTQVKKRKVVSAIEDALVTQQKKKDTYDVNDLKHVRNELYRIAETAQAIGEDALAAATKKTISVYSKRIASCLDNDAERQRNQQENEFLIAEAKKRRNAPLREQKKMLKGLEAIAEEHPEAAKLHQEYKTSIRTLRKRKNKRIRNAVVIGVTAAITAYGAYRIDNYFERLTKSDVIKKEQAASLQLQQYDQAIKEKKEELVMIEEEGRNTAAKQQRKAKTETPSAIEPILSSVVPNLLKDKQEQRLSHLHAPFILYVDKTKNTTTLYKNDGSIKQVKTYKHTDAVGDEPKTRLGQKATPEGIYHLTESYLDQNSNNRLFGVGFYKINYPTAQEQKEGYTGKGVLLCSAPDQSTEQAIKEGNDVMNVGIAVGKQDFIDLYRRLGKHYQESVIVIEDQRRPLEELR